MDTLTRDLRFALKRLAKDRGFVVAALLTLALCIGANAAIFSVVRSVLLRPLPYPDGDRLVYVYNSYPNAGAPRASSGVPDYFDRQAGVSALEHIALYQGRGYAVGESGATERLRGMRVTPSFFDVLGVQAARGRTFGEAENEPGNTHRVILSWGMWQERFGGRMDAIGTDLRIDGIAHTIVGVMPQDFMFDSPDHRLWLPVAFSPEERADNRRHSNNFQSIARLAPGASVEQAQAQIDAINAANLERFPEMRQIVINSGYHTIATPLQEDLTRDIRSTLVLLQSGVLLVLLIGCINIANLLLVRATARNRELATRMALGAGRGRLVRQLLTESVVLGLAGGVLGLLVGRAGLSAFAALGAAELPRGSEIRMDAAVALFTFALAAFAGLIFGLLPALRLRHADLSSVFREEGRTGTAGRGATIVRGSLVAAQVAAAFALLVAAGLMFASFSRTLAVDPGFDIDGVLTASVAVPVTRYPAGADRARFVDRALERVRAVPGVLSASFTSSIPLSGDFSSSVITPQGHVPQPGESPLSPFRSHVATDWFETMGIALVSGRTFTSADDADGERVVIIDEWLARRYWPGQDPVGQSIYDGIPEVDIGPEAANLLRIVGVVEDIRTSTLAGDDGVGHYYIPYPQGPTLNLVLAIRTNAADPAVALTTPLRSAIAAIDADLPVHNVLTMEERLAGSLRTERARAVLLIAFGAIALLLAAIGIYGVLAYVVSLRTTEIGIRVALGSPAAAVFALVLRQGFRWVGAGLVIGLLASLALGRLLAGLLHGVGATDPLVFGSVLAVLGGVAALACVIPARRAARVDPLIAMREGLV